MSSSSSGYSSSTPVVPAAALVTQALLNSIANTAVGYAQSYYNWGQQIFGQLQTVTNANMAALTNAADMAMTGAKTSIDQYTGSFLPDYNALRVDAAEYDNPARQARNAGLAESDQMQAGNSARQAMEQNLQSAGIDVSSGRYADLEAAQRTAMGAAAAGAGTQSIRADEATALGLKKQALDYGIQLPGIAANFLNQANQARSIGENAAIGTVNAGTSLGQLPNAYLATAMGDKYPPVGQQSSSGQSSNSQQQPRQSGSNNGGSSNGSGSDYGNNGSGGANGLGGGGAGAMVYAPAGSGADGGYGFVNNGYGTPEQDIPGGYSDTGGYDTGYDIPGGFSDTGGYGVSATGGYDNGADDSAIYSDAGGYSADDSGDYARGGAIPDQTPGGQVPVHASPSGGNKLDDVHANLTADEFVIPRDVAKWKGQEFFQKLIAQSRANLATAPAKGKPSPAPTGPVAFASRPTR